MVEVVDTDKFGNPTHAIFKYVLPETQIIVVDKIYNSNNSDCDHKIVPLTKPEDGWSHVCHKCGECWSQ